MVENLYNEKWLPVVGYEGLYEISTQNRVKALYKEWYSGANNSMLKKKDECLIKQNPVRGYRRVVLTKNGVQKGYSVHRLVGDAFIKNPENKPQINHINGIKSDNRLENLEWVTVSENQLHALRIGLKISQKRGDHSGARRIKCDTLDICFDCIKDAADILGVNETNIWKVCNNYITHLRGLSFKYI